MKILDLFVRKHSFPAPLSEACFQVMEGSGWMCSVDRISCHAVEPLKLQRTLQISWRTQSCNTDDFKLAIILTDWAFIVWKKSLFDFFFFIEFSSRGAVGPIAIIRRPAKDMFKAIPTTQCNVGHKLIYLLN